ncbi:MAG TPA: succinylglutamate desuccinylase/aspartoacylase family protein [Thermoanaerobaculia bacterium]
MSDPRPRLGRAWGAFRFAGRDVAPGASAEFRLGVSEYYTAEPLVIPVTVVRGHRPGPVLFLTAAVHGDELNGVAIIRGLLIDQDFTDLAGTLIAVPVVNVPGFLGQSRTLPDNRDLNRSFPGNAEGSFTARVAHRIFQDVVRRSDFGLDLHTAGGDRTNYPQIRADLSDRGAAELATAFGTPVVIHGPGPQGALRRVAAAAGVPTIVYEAGSARVFERRFIDEGLAGVLNVMRHLGMLDGGPPAPPPLRLEVKKSTWLRASAGGILDLKVSLGEAVKRGQVISVNTNPFGRERSQLASPAGGIVIGLTRSPLVHPGDAICHLARLKARDVGRWREYRKGQE